MNAYGIGQQTPGSVGLRPLRDPEGRLSGPGHPGTAGGVFLAWVETNLKRIIPAYLYLVIVPFVSLLLAVIVATPSSARSAAGLVTASASPPRPP